MLLLGTMSTAMASGELDWTTTNVEFHGNKLVVEGYFQNNTYKIVDRINHFDMRVHLKSHHGWREHTSGTFEDMQVYIRPGETMEHRFVIHNVDRLHFSEYNVRWRVNYHYHGHPHHEHHEHHDHHRD